MSESPQQRSLARHWPLLLPPAMWVLLLAGLLNSEIVRAILAVFCTALMLYQWLIYRKTNRGMQLLFLSLVIGGLALSSVWIGLNIVRFYTYDPESNRVWAWHVLIVQIQEIIKWSVVGLATVAFLCGLLLLARWINERLSAAS